MGLLKKKNKKSSAPLSNKPAKSPLEIVEPFTSSPAFTTRKKQPVFNREGSTSSNNKSNSFNREGSNSSNKSNSSNSDGRPRGSSSTLKHTRALSAGATHIRTDIQRSATIAAGDERSRPGGDARNKPRADVRNMPREEVRSTPSVPVEPTRTESIGASSSASSTASSVRALPLEFPAPSSTTLQMTLDELIKTARICKIPKTKRGYGFHVKGLAEKKKEFIPSVEAPCSQFMFGVDKDSESHKAGVMANDFIYKVNGKEVSLSSHKDVVDMIKKSGDPLVLSLIQVSNDLPTPTPVIVVPPPAVPKRDPKTKLKGPKSSTLARSQTASASLTTTSNGRTPHGQEQIYANMERAESPPSVEPESFRPPPPPAPVPTLVVPADLPRSLERMNSAPGGMTHGDGYMRRNTMPVKPPAPVPEAEERKEEVAMIPVLPMSSAAEILEQRKRLTSVQGDNQSLGSLKSTQSEPAKPVYVSRSPDNRPVIDDVQLPKSKSAEDIARKAAEMRKKRGKLQPGEKLYNYDLPPPPTAIPPPPSPPDDLPPPPPPGIEPPELPSPAIEPTSLPPPVTEPTVVPPPAAEPETLPPLVTEPTTMPPLITEPARAPSPPVPPPSVPEHDGDKEDNESYDSGFIQNGKHVEDWESADVADWLSGLGLGEYKEIFIENDIKGPNLVDLTKNDLKELGVTKLGHRITMMKEISTRLSETR